MAKSKNEQKVVAAPKQEPQRPVHQVRLGRIVCKVWENHHPTQGVWYSTTVSRLYKTNDKWRSSNSYGRDDLLLVGEVARQALNWIYRQQRPAASEGQENGQDAPTEDIPF